MSAAWQPKLKRRLGAGDQLLGCLLRMPADETVEMLGVAGFDFIVIDCEHGPADLIALRTHLALAQLHGMPALVRVGSAEPALVLRALDAGAEGVIAPHIDTAEQARALVASAHYPPTGQRGFATYGRAGQFGRIQPVEHLRTAVNTLVFGMIESPLGVRNVAEILAVPGFDGTMVGIADLRASSIAAEPDPSDAIEQVHKTAAQLGRYRMDIVSDLDQARASFRDGAQLVVYNLTATFMQHLAMLREAR